jgi:hypothetical protein
MAARPSVNWKGLAPDRESSFLTGEGFALRLEQRPAAANCSERFALISFNTSAPIAGRLLKPDPRHGRRATQRW